jgi:hypothetical protein
VAAAVCLLALISVLAVRTGEHPHRIAHHAVVTTVAVDQSSQVRAAQPLAIVAPAAVTTTLIAAAPEIAADLSCDCVPISSARTRGPPGTV